MIKKSIGQLLVNKKFITEDKLKEAQEGAQKIKISLEQYLIDNKILEDGVIAQVYAQELGLVYLEKIDDILADPKVLSRIPLKFLRENGVIPLKQSNEIVIATANPMEFQPLDELDMIFDHSTKVVIATRKVIIDALNHFYPLESGQMIEDLEEEGDMSDLSFGEIDERYYGCGQ
ncbi:MAG: hypothetical protein LVQ75_03250 [Candidatus Babeliales bacterium]|jgi:hypothetical protein